MKASEDGDDQRVLAAVLEDVVEERLAGAAAEETVDAGQTAEAGEAEAAR